MTYRRSSTFRGGTAPPSPPTETEIPTNPPPHFPGELWLETCAILDESRAQFPLTSQLLDLCKYIIPAMTPLYARAMRSGALTPIAVVVQGHGGILDLLAALAFSNLGMGSALQLGQEVLGSAEWIDFRKKITLIEKEMNEAGKPKPSAATKEKRKPRGLSVFTKAVRLLLLTSPKASGLDISRFLDDEDVRPTKKMDGKMYVEFYRSGRKCSKYLDGRYAKVRKALPPDFFR